MVLGLALGTPVGTPRWVLGLVLGTPVGTPRWVLGLALGTPVGIPKWIESTVCTTGTVFCGCMFGTVLCGNGYGCRRARCFAFSWWRTTKIGYGCRRALCFAFSWWRTLIKSKFGTEEFLIFLYLVSSELTLAALNIMRRFRSTSAYDKVANVLLVSD